MNKKLLYIAYFFPPLGGAGVQRPVKMIKYLKELGWDIDVLTVADIKFHSYDRSLLDEVSADNIYRADSFDPMSIAKKLKRKKSKDTNNLYFKTPEKFKVIVRGLFPIDDKIGWLLFAYKKALALCKTNNYDAIVATIGPYTSGVLAYKLSQKTKIPYFIDYRDFWTLHPYITYTFKFLYRHSQRYEKKMLQCAKGVFIVGDMMRDKLVAHFGKFLEDKTATIFNGYDEVDFIDALPETAKTHKVIRYVGNLYGNRDIAHLIQAIELLKSENGLPEDAVFEFVGNYYIEATNILNTETLKPQIKITPQIEHKDAVDKMRTADLLILIVATKDGEDSISGKIFEYIRANVPILALIPPEGEAANILKKLGHKYICQMEDTEKIKECLKDFFTSTETPQIKYDTMFSRENQTKSMHDFMMEKIK